ncbi:DinB family protein [Ornithinibacillus scapharcae]|uniref:DinB family protein n=1 Tax=Ornithinibacillus scapharcae TaxID=1147159 RepID=UPI000225AB8D|nr:DinB family protein [Ornithinibacillus scapharcae]
MNVKELLLAQLDACLENTWFVSLINSIDGLTEEQANWKPNETTNSIFEIVNHLIFYNHRSLNRFKDIPNDKKVDDNTFKNREELNWNATVKWINEIMSEWKDVVKKADTDKLDDMANELAHLTIHTTYHTGQIIYIRKLQGIWNPKNGVKG